MTSQQTLTVMRILMLSAILIVPSVALAQDKALIGGTFFGTLGSRTDTKEKQLGVGLGIELMKHQFGAGGEIQVFTGVGDQGTGKTGVLASTNGSYYFLIPRMKPVIPLATAGYPG